MANAPAINDSTAVPFSWVLKSLGVVVVAAPVIWWASMIQTNLSSLTEAVKPIPQMAQDIAVIKAQRTVTSADSSQEDGKVAVSSPMPAVKNQYASSVQYVSVYDDVTGALVPGTISNGVLSTKANTSMSHVTK